MKRSEAINRIAEFMVDNSLGAVWMYSKNEELLDFLEKEIGLMPVKIHEETKVTSVVYGEWDPEDGLTPGLRDPDYTHGSGR